MTKKELIVIAGIPGVGKTTVLEEAVKIAKEKGKKYRVINFGDVMLEIAKADGLVNHRDEMRTLPLEKQKEIQREAAKKIASLSYEENIIVDTHVSIKTPKGYMPGLPLWVLEELEPTSIILIEALPEEIYTRRKRDETRKRDIESLERIDLHQKYNRYMAAAYAMVSGASVDIVVNKEGKILQAVKDLVKLLMEGKGE